MKGLFCDFITTLTPRCSQSPATHTSSGPFNIDPGPPSLYGHSIDMISSSLAIVSRWPISLVYFWQLIVLRGSKNASRKIDGFNQCFSRNYGKIFKDGRERAFLVVVVKDWLFAKTKEKIKNPEFFGLSSLILWQADRTQDLWLSGKSCLLCQSAVLINLCCHQTVSRLSDSLTVWLWESLPLGVFF